MKSNKKRIIVCKNHGFPRALLALSLVMAFLGVLVLLNYSSFLWRLLDQLAENIVLQLRSESLNAVMLGFSDWGTYATIIGWMLLAFWFAYKRQWSWLLLVICLSIGGYFLGSGIKLMVGRERPAAYAMVVEVSHSIPSLHTLNSTIFYLALTYLLFHFSRYFWRSLLVFFISLAFIFTIGISRVYLGIHYFSDISAGFLLGVAYLTLVLLSFRVHELVCLRTKKVI